MSEHTYINNDFSDILKGRRSIRQYDPSVKIDRDIMKQILEDATTAPSSINMQPWRFVVVDTPEGKDKLRPLVGFNSRQSDSSAAMILIFGDLKSFDNAEKIYSKSVEIGGLTEEIKEKQLGRFAQMYDNMPEEGLKQIALIDAGLVSMQLMLVARAYGYDTNAIGGFDRANLAEAFDMDPTRHMPVMIVSIGKAAEEGKQTARLPITDITTWK